MRSRADIRDEYSKLIRDKPVIQAVFRRYVRYVMFRRWPCYRTLQRRFHLYGLMDPRAVITLRNNGSLLQWYQREIMCSEFSFAIPCREALLLIKSYGSILEVGAGLGFWSFLLRKIGCDVKPTDDKTWPRGKHQDGDVMNVKEFVKVRKLSANKAVTLFPGRTVLCIWPCMGFDFSDRSWERVSRVIYIGEGPGGCTGSDSFHDRLEKDFTVVKEMAIPQWWGIHDVLYVYEKKGAGINANQTTTL